MSVTVYGASDDLIEVEGDIDAEFYPFNGAVGLDGEDGALLGFSDGTVLRVIYSKQGVWRIRPVIERPGTLEITLAPEDDEDNYSDRATLTGDVRWVVKGNDIARSS